MDFTPQKIEKVEDEALRIVWGDGHRSEFSFRELRLLCRCAQCRDEWTGRLLIEPGSVPAEMRGQGAALVGNYALAFQFSDGHATGVYTFEMLRHACPCAACARDRGVEGAKPSAACVSPPVDPTQVADGMAPDSRARPDGAS